MPPQFRPSSQRIDLNTTDGKKQYQRMIEASSEKLSFDSKKASETKHLLETKVKQVGLSNEMSTFASGIDNNFNQTETVNAMVDYYNIGQKVLTVNGGFVFNSLFDDDGGVVKPTHDFSVNIDENDEDATDLAMRNDIFGQWIMNSMTTKDQMKMNMHKDLFEYNADEGEETLLDGIAMAVLLLQKTQPLTKHSVTNLKTFIRNCDPNEYDSMTDALDGVEAKYKEILEKKGSHDDFLLDLFLIGSKSNDSKMVKYVERLQEKYEDGEEDLTPQEVMKQMKQKEITLKEREAAKSQSSKKKSTSANGTEADVKLTVLTNQLTQLQNKIQELEGSNNHGGTSRNTRGNGVIPSWRYVKTGGTIEKEGKTWHWCQHHNDEKGMYVTHRESEHGDWEERKRRQKRDKTSSSREGASDTSTSTRKEQVKVNDNLKHALATRGFSQDQIAAIMEESGSSDFGSSRG